MLGHILETWLKDKSQKVQHLFEEKLTGGILDCARRNMADADRLIGIVNNLLLTCTEGSDKR